MIQKIVALLLVVGSCSLIGCVNKEGSSLIPEGTPIPQPQQLPTPQLQETSINEVENQCKIYIGTNGEFKEYVVTSEYADFDNPEKASLCLGDLIKQMSALTGWNLDCNISVYKTIGVAFSKDSTLFVGPPEIQKEEFHLFDETQMVETILDSVAKTIQMNIGDDTPDLVEVYFSTEEDEELTFTDINMYVPLGENYAGLKQIPE